MKLIGFALVFFLLARPVQGYVDLPVPQTSGVLEFALPKPHKKGVVRVIAKYDSKEDATILKSLSVTIDSEETIIPVRVLKLFEGPRLDTIRLFVSPEMMNFPNDLPPKEQDYFAVTFRFLATASTYESLENRPTAWIAVKHGKITGIREIQDIRKNTLSSKEYDPITLKRIGRNRY